MQLIFHPSFSSLAIVVEMPVYRIRTGVVGREVHPFETDVWFSYQHSATSFSLYADSNADSKTQLRFVSLRTFTLPLFSR